MSQTSDIKLRTLHVDTEPTWRGGEQQVFYLTTGLVARGHVAEIACLPGSPLSERARAAGVPVHEIKMRGEIDICAAWKLSRIIRRGNYDIIHSHTSHAHVIAGMAAWLAGTKTKRIVARRVDFRIDRNFLSKIKYCLWSDRYISVSKAVKNIMISGGVPAEKISVVNSSVDLARFENVEPGDIRAEYHLPADAILIVDAAFLVEHKAQKYLVEAMPLVLKEIPNAYCLLVGDGELRPALEAQVAALGLKERVIFTGFRKDALRFIKGADVSVMCSQEDGFGNSVQETLALKRPIVASDAGGIPEMVENGVNGIVVPRKNAAALAEGIVRMLRNPNDAHRFVEAGRKTIEEKFTKDVMVEKTLAVYMEVLNK